MAASARQSEREEPEADGGEDRQARQSPVRDLRRRQYVGDQEKCREEIEHAVCEHRADERRPSFAAPLLVTGEDGDARELPDPARQDGIGEEADAEG